MRRKLSLLFALAAGCFLVLPMARADEASKRAKVEELFTLTKVDTMMTQMSGQMTAAMKASASEQTATLHLTPEQQVYSDKFMAKVDAIIKESLSMETLKPVFLKVYLEVYTEDELDGIVAFYRSPAGQAFVSKTPMLMERSMQLMQDQMAAVQPKLEEAQRELAVEMEQTTKAKP